MTEEQSQSHEIAADAKASFLGHPRGLFVLFFVEMWERFSYYGMRALLIFYMTKGFLHYGDKQAYGIYGAYTALVYATPFIGGMLADKLLGQARAVILGGMLMAAGHLLMTIEHTTAFFTALALLICGNGFFKPNISTMVGSMYPAGNPKRDGGFTIFYMGINLGAAMSPLLCGYVGETFGWHYGFGLATIGMLSGLFTFVANRTLSRVLIGLTAFVTVAGMVWIGRGDSVMLVVNAPVGLALLVGAAVAISALASGGLPMGLGAPRDGAKLSAPVAAGLPWLSRTNAVYLGTVVAVPLIAMLLRSGPLVAWLGLDESSLQSLPEFVRKLTLAGALLIVFGGGALLLLLVDAIRSVKIERERLFVVLILMFFSMLFWASFEQAGSSMNNFADRNVDRIVGGRVLTQADVGTELKDVPITSTFFGRTIDGKEWNLTTVEAANAEARKQAEQSAAVSGTPLPSGEPVFAKLPSVTVTDALVGMKVYGTEIKASIFQATNPVCIVTFGLIFTMAWAFLGARGLEPNTSIKFALGLLQLGLGFGAIWFGAQNASSHGFVAMGWLLLGYLLHTTGELCLSPVGLSMVTKLSPTRMVSTVMGAWFLATAFSNYLAGMIAALTGVGGHAGGEESTIPPPIETVHVYGDVFGQIAVAAIISSVVLLVISPLLTRWMHGADEAGGGH
jgi:proton-dependent oligopeptide transporter, POT family